MPHHAKAQENFIIPMGKDTPWQMRYMQEENSSNNPSQGPADDTNGKSWLDLAYDDSSWGVLTGPMGRQSEPSANVNHYVNPNFSWEGDYYMFYLRRTFNLPAKPTESMTLHLIHDDGVEVYINGTLIINESGLKDNWYSCPVDPDVFVKGTNIIAIKFIADTYRDYLDFGLEGVITDEDGIVHPKLFLETSKVDLEEGDTFTLTVKADRASETATTLMLTCDNSARFDFPSKLVLPAGETSVTTTVNVIDDNDIAETLSAAFIVSAPDYESGQALVMVSDDDMPHIELALAPTTVMADAGANAIMGTIRRSDNLNSKVTVMLSDDGDGLLTYSSEKVTLERGATEAHFTIGTKGMLSDDREVNITAAVYVKTCDCTAGAQSGGSTTQKVTLLSGQGAPMKIAPLTTGFSTEGGNNGLVITIESAASNAVTVNVTSDSDVNLSYAHSVTIPAGETTVTVPVTMSGSGEIAEGQVITFTATASGYATATCWAVTTASSLPDAIVTSFEASAAEAEAESEVELTIMVKNAGNGALSEETPVKVTLSDGSYPVVLRTEKSLASGESMTLTTSYQLPALTGDYVFQAIVNPTGSVEEVVTSNNMSQEIPITIKPSYQVTAATDKTRYGQGEVITVMGKATGTKNSFADVEVYFVNDGMRQTVKAKTDSEGNYKALFLPLDGTAGHFAIGACFPGEEKTDAMAEVDVFGLKMQNSRTTCTVGQGGSYSGSITVTNNGDLPQTGIRVEQQDSPIGCEFSFQTISKIEAGETLEIPFTITSNDDSTEGKERMTLLFRSNEGAMAEHAIDYSIDPAVGCLKTDSTAIVMTITKDKAREFPVTIWNTGLAPTGTVSLTLPSWIQSVTPRQLPSLAPGDTVMVLLRIVPDGKMYENIARTGRVGMNCAQGSGLTLQIEVTPVAEENGAITIDVLDEFAWCTEEKPHVTGAKVELVNKATQTVVAEGLTGTDGKFAVAEIPGGWYQLKVSAAYHESYDGMLLVDPGRSRTKEIFISFNGITKEWKVEETEVEDEYSMETVMKFETMVPPPYIEVQWPEEKPVPGKYFPVTIVNKGLLKFYDVKANLHVSSGRYGLEIMGSSDIDTLDAGQAVVLYARLTTASTPAQIKKAVSTVSSDCFGLSSDVEVCYMCVMPIEKSFTSDKNYGKCYVSTNESSGGNGGGGAGGGAGAGGDDNDYNPPTEDPEEFACDLPRFKIVSVKDGKDMLGVATDGASQVKIVIDGEYDQKLRDLIKKVKWEIAGDDGSTDMGKLKNENLLEGAVYTAPSYYSGGDASSYKVKLNVSLVMKENGIEDEKHIDSAVEIELIRVPVLMVHGLNSDPNCWKQIGPLGERGLYDYLTDHYVTPGGSFHTSRGYYRDFQTSVVDYNKSNKNRFSENYTIIGKYLFKLFQQVRKEKYVAEKVDVVAHSMGGLLTKMYMQIFPASKHLFNKVITINTPHGGSQLGNFMNDPIINFIHKVQPLENIVQPGVYPPIMEINPHAHKIQRSVINTLFETFYPREKDGNTPIKNMSIGAVADLSVNMPAIVDINNDNTRGEEGKYRVNCHAIVTSGIGNSWVFWKQSGQLKLSYKILYGMLGYNRVENLVQDIFDDESDMVVAATSQLGGLDENSGAVSYLPIEHPGGNNYTHTETCKNSVIQNEVLRLLMSNNESDFSDGFRSTAPIEYAMRGIDKDEDGRAMTWKHILNEFPYYSISNAEELYDEYHSYDDSAFSEWRENNRANSRKQVQLVSTVLPSLSISHEYNESDTLMYLKVVPKGEFSKISFGCFYQDMPIAYEESPEGTVWLPRKVQGEIVVLYEGQSTDGNWYGGTDTIPINTIGNTTMQSLSFVMGSELIINDEYITPKVLCTWSDGMVTEVEDATLSVSNGNLAYIEDNKYVYGKNSGRTMLNATYGNLSCSTRLEVYISGSEDSTEGNGSGKTSNSVCSSASLGFKQGSVMTRQAFRGTLTINNNHPSLPLQNLKLHIEVRDEEGNLATQREFQINPEALNGDFEGELDFDSGWNLKNGGTGVATILFIPTKNAAPTEPKRWSFGGTLTYTDPFTGLVFTATLKPVTLTVKPTPVLDFTYFMQRDVIGDYLWTPDVTEPSIPAEFALLINNKGNADAKDLKFICKEPQIEDSNGLKINFSIKDTQLNGEQKALAMDDNMPIEVGNLAAQSQAYVQWWLNSSLLGHFTEYDASFNHQTSYGNEDLSLVDQVTILELIHGFTPSQQSAPARAFLVDALEDSKDTPDKIYFTDATQQEVTEASTATISKMSANSYLLIVTPSRGGWTYVNIDSSVGKNMQVASITRQSDGAEIPADNAWLTEVTFVDHDDPTLEEKLHFIGDVPEGGEQYLVTFDYQPTDYLKVERYEGLPEEDVALEGPLTELTVHFNKAVNEETFTVDDLTLYHEGTPVDLSTVGISKTGENVYRLNLGTATNESGYYVLMVNTQTITDSEGFEGTSSPDASWVQNGGHNPNATIVFADAEVKRICVENWDINGDGELSYSEAAAVTDLGQVFKSNRTIELFEELQYFTGLTTLPECAFQNCMNLLKVRLPRTIITIEHSVFENCYKLTDVTLHEGIESIDWAAFSGCRSITSVTIPASTTSLSSNPFSHCYILSEVSVAEGNPVYDSRNNCNAVIETATNKLVMGCNNSIIPEGIVELGSLAFAGYEVFSSIELPSTLRILDNQVFIDCSSLTSIDLKNVTDIGYACFGGTPLTIVHIPSTVERIDFSNPFGDSAIESITVDPSNPYYDSRDNCNAIIAKNFTNTILRDGKKAVNVLVSGCKNTIIPSSVRAIGDDAFKYCKMNTIDIPEGVESILYGAFMRSEIQTIKLPKSLTFLDECAFYYCNQLASVIVQNAVPLSIANSTFNTRSSITLYVPYGSKAVYEAADVWKEFKEIVEVKPDNFLYASEATVRLGDKKTIALQLDNTESLIAAEFRLQLPAGLTIEKDENNNLVAAIVGDRRVNHTLTVKDEGNGLYHFLSYSNPIRAYNGNSGDFITLSIVSDGSMEEGTYTATLKSIIFSDENEQKLTFDDCSFNISVIDYTPGDVNSDGSLDVMDVVKMVSYIMGRNPSNFKFVAADIDGNGKVNVMDLVNLINLIMTTPQQTSGIAPHAQVGSMELSKSGDEAIAVSIPFADRHVAAQFVVSVTDGAVLQEVVADEAHQSKFTRMSDGRYKVMVFSGNNATFSSDSPIKLQLSGNGDVKLEDAMFVDIDEEAVAFESVMLNTTGITTVGTTFAQPVDIYTVGGKLVKNGATSTKGLAKGVYVVNNQKLIVK